MYNIYFLLVYSTVFWGRYDPYLHSACLSHSLSRLSAMCQFIGWLACRLAFVIEGPK